jgi:hypothetical protein
MPQPCDPKRRTWPAKLSLQRPDCALQLSAVVVEWAHVERVMTRLMSTAMGPDALDRVAGTVALGSWVAAGVMSSLESTNSRLRVVKTVLIPLLPPELAERWENIEKEYRACGQQRNIVAHSAWSLSDEYPDDLLRQDSRGRTFRHTASDFSEIADRVYQLRMTLEAFLSDLIACAAEGKCGLR